MILNFFKVMPEKDKKVFFLMTAYVMLVIIAAILGPCTAVWKENIDSNNLIYSQTRQGPYSPSALQQPKGLKGPYPM
jgi:hypothetical protein